MASIAQVMGTVAIHPATAPRTMSPNTVPSCEVPGMSGTLRASGPRFANQDKAPGDDKDHLGCRIKEVDGQDYFPGDVDDVDPDQSQGTCDGQNRHLHRILAATGGNKERTGDGG